ncbi:hypothetical protein CH063_08066 [Colletotrichum higginsianum]|uniref:Rhodopsin domain-containing protein n=1 Tax=Colletotrichum higginsianum (strain IMI 349063) TaxID=759273 RepID=H1V8G3_COLHI|nr:hypothetical protein CH063_08066 [Colletotrichum higginsianum]
MGEEIGPSTYMGGDVFNYDASWRQCKDKSEEQSMMLAHAIISIFVDCMLVALPLWVVTNYLKMGVKAIQILLVFSFGIFAVATGIVRLSIIITTDFSVNTTYKMLTVAAWTDAELHVGLWSSYKQKRYDCLYGHVQQKERYQPVVAQLRLFLEYRWPTK